MYKRQELSTAAQPAYANPTAQGVMAILAIVVNVLCITIIIKRSLEQKKNPYKNEIFTDQKDFQIAMAVSYTHLRLLQWQPKRQSWKVCSGK